MNTYKSYKNARGFVRADVLSDTSTAWQRDNNNLIYLHFNIPMNIWNVACVVKFGCLLERISIKLVFSRFQSAAPMFARLVSFRI